MTIVGRVPSFNRDSDASESGRGDYSDIDLEFSRSDLCRVLDLLKMQESCEPQLHCVYLKSEIQETEFWKTSSAHMQVRF